MPPIVDSMTMSVCVVDDINVIADRTRHSVDAGPAVEQVVAGAAVQSIVAAQAQEACRFRPTRRARCRRCCRDDIVQVVAGAPWTALPVRLRISM